jgi:hypothetical protein
VAVLIAATITPAAVFTGSGLDAPQHLVAVSRLAGLWPHISRTRIARNRTYMAMVIP